MKWFKNKNVKGILKARRLTILGALFLTALPAAAWEIEGVEGGIADNLAQVLAAESESCDVAIDQEPLFGDSLEMRLLSAIKPFGYFDAQISITQDDEVSSCKELTYLIELNDPVLVSESSNAFVGAGVEEAALNALVNDFPLKNGVVLNTVLYESFKSEMVRKAQSLGYLAAHFVASEIKVNQQVKQAQIHWHFDTGPLYHFSSVAFEQSESFLDAGFLNNMLNIKAGDVVLNSSIHQQIDVLNDSLYFSQVTAQKQNQSKENATVDLLFKVSPAKRIKYSVGVGYATDTGARTTLEYQNDRVGNKAYQFKSQAKIAETNQNLTARLKIPSRSKPLKKWYAIDAGYLFEDVEDKEENSKKLSFSQTRLYSEAWQNTNFIDITDIEFGFDGEPKRTAFLVVPGVSWSWRKADDWTRAKHGISVHATLQAASESLGSDVDFVQAELKSKWIHTLGDQNRMIYRGQLGSTSVDDLQALPFSYRFYAGGDRNVRGFDYESLSPVNANDDLIGGKHLVALSAEFEHNFRADWAWAVFADTGNAFTDDLDWKKSVGLGVRWFSPLGPVRLDLAHPLDDDESGIKVHFTIGPDF